MKQHTASLSRDGLNQGINQSCRCHAQTPRVSHLHVSLTSRSGPTRSARLPSGGGTAGQARSQGDAAGAALAAASACSSFTPPVGLAAAGWPRLARQRLVQTASAVCWRQTTRHAMTATGKRRSAQLGQRASVQ